MNTPLRIALKLCWMVALVAALIVASRSTVDFVYRGF
jgi:hypothetical protein